MKTYPVVVTTAALVLMSSAVFAQAQTQADQLPGQAQAQPPGQSESQPGNSSLGDAFTALDVNKDQQIDRAESQSSPVVSQSFATADKDGSGAISREEFNSSFTVRSPAAASSPDSPSTANPPQ
jgi:hypothetical protein